MTHSKLPGQEIHVPELAVDGHRRTGWEVAEDPPQPAPAAEPAERADTPADTAPATDKPAATSRRFTPSPASKE